jgi:outer membrane protein OmpA-like peptidoglycan-associated protein
MSFRKILPVLLLAAAFGAQAASDLDADVARLSQRLAAVETDPQLNTFAAYERLQAHQAINALTQAGKRERGAALYLAERRVQIAEISAHSQAAQREVDQLDRERSELLIEASRRDADLARAENERLRLQAQMQAEEAERLRQQSEADAAAMADVESALKGVAGAQTARLNAAREREAALARQEAELTTGGKLPPSKRDGRGEVFTLSKDTFASGKATLSGAGSTAVSTLAAYVQASKAGSVKVQAQAADAKLSQRRAEAVRDALVAGGVESSRIQVSGRSGKSDRLEAVVSSK